MVDSAIGRARSLISDPVRDEANGSARFLSSKGRVKVRGHGERLSSTLH
jgi:hypothetical protein